MTSESTNASILSLESYIEKKYDEITATAKSVNSKSTKASAMASSTDVIESTVNNVNNLPKHGNIVSTPTTSNGVLIQDESSINKKRKVISPAFSTVHDHSDDNEELGKVVELVYNRTVIVISKWMHEQSMKFQALETDLKERTDSVEKEDISSLQEDVSNLQEEVSKLTDQLKVSIGRITRAEKERDDLKEQLLQMEARMMRDNLVFYNIDEEVDEPVHDCRGILNHFLKKEMKISDQDMAKIGYDRVHRMGKKGANKRRPIVAKFNPVDGKRIVMEHIKNLDRKKKFGVNDQLPRELESRKKKLMPVFKDAKKEKQQPKWQLDKLVIGKKVTTAHKDTVMDINSATTEIASTMVVKHAPPKSYEGSSFRGHNVKVDNQDEIVPALHAIYSDERVARATHNIYAYRLNNGAEHCEDDGEWGAGQVLLQILREHNVTNRLVCVTRWYGKRHLGRARFDYIKDAALTTLGLL